MLEEFHSLKIVLILTVGFTFASILGYLSQRLKLSPIIGYLVAGYLIGPYSPGFVADLAVSEQLAEIGVILMMFGVGMHFKWQDLANVRSVAIPGAIGQTLVAATLTAFLVYNMGMSLGAGILLGLAVGVASTVVMVRVLAENNLLNTKDGHIAVGWLIVEDVFTVIVLLLLPTIAAALQGEHFSFLNITEAIAVGLGKFVILVILMVTVGYKFVTYILFKVARLRSNELFTLTVLALTFGIATGSAVLFGTSIALGAFIAGMVVGQTDVRHQASANALPLKDAFLVIFFLSVGMLFNPEVTVQYPLLFFGILGIIILIKPLTAAVIVLLLKYPLKTALTVSLALAQIGEFSFILSEEALKVKILPDEGFDLIVACALVSIGLNPILMRIPAFLNTYLKKRKASSVIPIEKKRAPSFASLTAVVIGFGPVGKSAVDVLEKLGYEITIIDNNVDTIATLIQEKRNALFGDATQHHILEATDIESSSLLVITIPDDEVTVDIIKTAQHFNPRIQIIARARYSSRQALIEEFGVKVISGEEELIKAFKTALENLQDL
jgi:CPA2 family monovalent cation:H+ antiporter-2